MTMSGAGVSRPKKGLRDLRVTRFLIWLVGRHTAPVFELFHSYVFQADVYSFGLVIWECLSRKLPFEGMHPHTVVYQVVKRGLRPDCRDLIDPENEEETFLLNLAKKCWSADPNMRPEFEEICGNFKK